MYYLVVLFIAKCLANSCYSHYADKTPKGNYPKRVIHTFFTA